MKQDESYIKFSESFYLWLKIRGLSYSDYNLKDFCLEWNENLTKANDKAINDFYHNLVLQIKVKIDNGKYRADDTNNTSSKENK